MPKRSPFILSNAKRYQITPTYDGSGIAVHPDIVYFQKVWHGYKYWMVLTPFFKGHNHPGNPYENPSILAGNDGFTWEVPPGLRNPLVKTPPGGYLQQKGISCNQRKKGFESFSHNADSDMVYNETTDELWVYYMEVRADELKVHLRLLKTENGIDWTEPQRLITWDREGDEDNGRSYAVVKEGDKWHMWYERGLGDNTWVEYRTSNDGINWSEPQKVNIYQKGYNVWHLDVIYVPTKAEYWMLFCGYPISDARLPVGEGWCLFFARSKDRLNWVTYNNPVLSPGSGWDHMPYRATFLYDIEDDGKIRVWYSALNRADEFRIGYTSAFL